uniref:Uncharacterized protein n=1 Tax=Noctiluca scintillans TaxID=2966 RepID=A0A7S0ZMB4_NOCSC|mmetsp:Transcript_10649/g.29511  ORF Transcript_10649/g.29511 Transcript_10649/m.29511 type:complete len:1376 (+) Transcript_10649:63-4190(+)
MVCFEVAQATIKHWAFTKASFQQFIFLEVYVQQDSFQANSSCSCGLRPFSRGGTGTAQSRCRTGLVDEAEEMLWRRYNDENFAVALFASEPGWRLKLGETTKLVLHVCRSPTRDDVKSASRVRTLFGSFVVGVFGAITVACETQCVATLELRPVWTRPFCLDLARPGGSPTASSCMLEHSGQGLLSKQGVPKATAPSVATRLSLLRSSITRARLSRIDWDTMPKVLRASLLNAPFWQGSKDNAKCCQSLRRQAAVLLFSDHQESRTKVHSSWLPADWTVTWRDSWPADGDHLRGKYGLAPLMEAEFRRDCIILFNTLFPRAKGEPFLNLRDWAFDLHVEMSFKNLSRTLSTVGKDWAERYTPDEDEIAQSDAESLKASSYGELSDDYSPRIMFLKRLLLCFATCGVYFSEDEKTKLAPWPYPIAALLGHGSRVLIRLEDVSAPEFMNFLLTGDPNSTDWKDSGIPAPLKRRMAATHSVEMHNGELMEKKLGVTSVTDSMQNIYDGIKKKHLGLNLPIGGVGNPSPMGADTIIGFTGTVVTQESKSFRRANSARRQLENITRFMVSRGSLSDSGESSRNSKYSFSSSRSSRSIATSESSSSASCYDLRMPSGSKRGRWRVLPHVQGGHLYVRIDDFGQHPVDTDLDNVDLMKRRLQDSSLEQVTRRRTDLMGVARHVSPAGDLCLPPAHRVSQKHGFVEVLHGAARLVRVMSEPDLQPDTDASIDDLCWVQLAVVSMCATLAAPPSCVALALLLKHYGIVNESRLVSEDSVRALYADLVERRCALVKRSGAVQLLVESFVLHLKLLGHVLVSVPYHGRRSWSLSSTCSDSDCSSSCSRKAPMTGLPVGPVLAGEPWKTTITRFLCENLELFEEHLTAILSPWDDTCHSVIQDRKMSVSHPGLQTDFKTHVVYWEIRDEAVSWLKCPPGGLKDCFSFRTMRLDSSGCTALRWRWARDTESAASFVSLREGESPQLVSSVDDIWARRACERDGVVRPSTEHALECLFLRCGVTVVSIPDAFLELQRGEAHLCLRRGILHRVVERVFVRLRLKTPDGTISVLASRRWDDNGEVMSLPNALLRVNEAWQEAATLCAMTALGLKKQQVASLGTPDCRQCEQCHRNSSLRNLQRTHLVTYDLKEEPGIFTRVRGKKRHHRRIKSLAPDDASDWAEDPARSVSWHCSLSSEFQSETVWLEEGALAEVEGANFGNIPTQYELRRVSSVLLGLEGCAPNTQSPFENVSHSVTATSNSISAFGNRKWRTYRANNALQIPSDKGGMRSRLTREMFSELVDNCERVGLVSPSVDLLLKRGDSHPRDLLGQKFLERELFKVILASCGEDARRAVQWMRQYRAEHPTPEQAYETICSGRRSGLISENWMW